MFCSKSRALARGFGSYRGLLSFRANCTEDTRKHSKTLLALANTAIYRTGATWRSKIPLGPARGPAERSKVPLGPCSGPTERSKVPLRPALGPTECSKVPLGPASGPTERSKVPLGPALEPPRRSKMPLGPISGLRIAARASLRASSI